LEKISTLERQKTFLCLSFGKNQIEKAKNVCLDVGGHSACDGFMFSTVQLNVSCRPEEDIFVPQQSLLMFFFSVNVDINFCSKHVSKNQLSSSA